jgi:hypothetical protein
MPDNGAIQKSRVCCAWCGRPLLHAKATPDTPVVIRALGSGTACLPCLVSATGHLEPEIISALRRLRADVNLAVGSCSRCGAEARLLCGLTTAGNTTGETVIFDHGELVHVDCHRDRPLSPQRSLSKAMRWPR